MKYNVEIDVDMGFGHERWYGASEFAKFLCEIRGSPCLQEKEVKSCIDHGFKVSYTHGKKGGISTKLENLGATRK